MNLKEYQELASRTCNDLNDEVANNTHMLFGMITEVAEAIDAYKKSWAYGKELDLTNVKEEIGDLLWYVANFARFNNFDLEKIMERNIEKLQARYPEKYTNENAINRDLNVEREILEK